MSLSRDQVEKVSLLARLRLTEAELDAMTAQLGQIVRYVELLEELDTKGTHGRGSGFPRPIVLLAHSP